VQALSGEASRFSDHLAVDADNDDIIDTTEEVLSQQALEQSQSSSRYKMFRNGSLIYSHRQASAYKLGDIDLKPGTCVELREPLGKWKV
jgi:hypothetical protein